MTMTAEAAEREDRDLIEMIREWDDKLAQARHDVANRGDLLDRVADLEGQIRRREPNSFLAVQMILRMAFKIAASRCYDSDRYISEGPLVDLLGRVQASLDQAHGPLP